MRRDTYLAVEIQQIEAEQADLYLDLRHVRVLELLI